MAVVGDGAVGLTGVLTAQQMGTARIIAMSRHKARQKFALEYGATDIVTERVDAGVAQIKDMTPNVGADAVLEWRRYQWSMHQAIILRVPQDAATDLSDRAVIRKLIGFPSSSQWVRALGSSWPATITALAPLLAPSNGGQILALSSWRAIFWTLW